MFFPIFLENDLSKVDKILGLTFFLRQDCKRFCFPFSVADLFARYNVYNSRLFAYKRPGVVNRLNLIDIVFIYQSVEIDDTLLLFIN